MKNMLLAVLLLAATIHVYPYAFRHGYYRVHDEFITIDKNAGCSFYYGLQRGEYRVMWDNNNERRVLVERKKR